MDIQLTKRRTRRGQVAIMTCLMVPVLLGAALISTDTAILMSAEAQMKTSADAAALAGAMALVDETRVRGATNLTNLMTTASSKATTLATSNRVLGLNPVVINNSGNAATGDVVIGYHDPANTGSSTPTTSGSQSLFNSVMVTIQRNATHGGAIPTFFGGPLGIGSTSLAVTSMATVQNHAIQGFRNVTGQTVTLLPFVLDKSTYTAMINRTTADQYSYNPSTGAVTPGADGVPESQLYPVGSGNPGNWGAINIGVSNNSTSILSSQIQYGITAAQLATYPNSTIQLDQSLNPPSITFSGNPGISAGIKSAVAARIGTTGYIGVYDQSSGNGNNTNFRVIAFAAVRIMASNFQGNPKYVLVQPALINDETAIPGDAQSSWTNGGVVQVYLSR